MDGSNNIAKFINSPFDTERIIGEDIQFNFDTFYHHGLIIIYCHYRWVIIVLQNHRIKDNVIETRSKQKVG